MSLNLGNDAIDALRKLHLHPDSAELLQKFRDGLLEQSRKYMNLALDGAGEHTHMAVGYARACRDLWRAIESAATGVTMNKVEQHGPEVKRAAAR